MPLTLYGYILRELLKVLGAATLVLTVVMSVAFAIMSVSQGLLGPWAMVKIIFYVVPGMLTIALPFAAALAGTLVFFRMSQDNEVTACAVGGISYFGLLVPVMVLGMGMTAGMFWFSNWVVPRFWRLAEQEGTADAVRIVVGKIQRREVFEWESGAHNLVIHADAAQMDVPIPPTPGGQLRPYNRLVMQGVAVGWLDEDTDRMGAVRTAEEAWVDLFRDEDTDRTYATMLLRGVSQNDPESGDIGTLGSLSIAAVEIPTQFGDKPQFMSLRRLQRLAADPLRSPEVRGTKRDLAQAMAQDRILSDLTDKLGRAGSEVELEGIQGQSLRVAAPRVEREKWRLLLKKGDGDALVRAVLLVGGVRAKTYEARSAVVEFADSLSDDEPRLNMVLSGVTVHDWTLQPGKNELDEVRVPLLWTGTEVLGPLRRMPLEQLLDEAAGTKLQAVERARNRTEEKIVELKREILSRVHERAATAVNCSLVLLLGVVMSMLLRRQTPLAIFFWCFMPTVAAFLTISSGQQMMGWDRLPVWLGSAMLWSGNAGLAAIVTGVYWRLKRN